MNDLLSNTAVIGFIVGIPSLILGYLVYKQSQKVDKTTEQSGIANTQLTAVGQVLSGLNQLIDNLQTDNKELRENIKAIGIRLKEVIDERDTLIKEMDKLNKLYKNGNDRK